MMKLNDNKPVRDQQIHPKCSMITLLTKTAR